MTDALKARDLWAGMTRAQRLALIEKVHGDAAAAALDWAGLPPQAQTAIIATMAPEPPSEEHPEGEEDHKSRRKRGE
jgi:hypothetical protein